MTKHSSVNSHHQLLLLPLGITLHRLCVAILLSSLLVLSSCTGDDQSSPTTMDVSRVDGFPESGSDPLLDEFPDSGLESDVSESSVLVPNNDPEDENPELAASDLQVSSESPFTTSSDEREENGASMFADLQGTWRTDVCDSSLFDRSSREELVFNGTSFVQSLITYRGNQTCSGDLTFTLSAPATFSASGETTELDGGPAKHIDVSYENASIAGSDALIALLESTGTTLQDTLSTEGIPDIRNIQVSDLPVEYSIYRVTGNQLQIGSSSEGANDGSSPEHRANRLNTDIYIKQ